MASQACIELGSTAQDGQQFELDMSAIASSFACKREVGGRRRCAM